MFCCGGKKNNKHEVDATKTGAKTAKKNQNETNGVVNEQSNVNGVVVPPVAGADQLGSGGIGAQMAGDKGRLILGKYTVVEGKEGLLGILGFPGLYWCVLSWGVLTKDKVVEGTGIGADMRSPLVLRK